MNRPRPSKTSLALTFDAIARALRPVAWPAAREAALKERLLSRVAGDARRPPLSTLRAHEGAWQGFAPGIEVKVLHETADMVSALVRMAPGASTPAHEHAADEECLVLEGEIYFDDVRARAGDFHLAPKGSWHTMRTDTGVLMHVRTATALLRAQAEA